jgi:hypothetical protein
MRPDTALTGAITPRPAERLARGRVESVLSGLLGFAGAFDELCVFGGSSLRWGLCLNRR